MQQARLLQLILFWKQSVRVRRKRKTVVFHSVHSFIPETLPSVYGGTYFLIPQDFAPTHSTETTCCSLMPDGSLFLTVQSTARPKPHNQCVCYCVEEEKQQQLNLTHYLPLTLAVIDLCSQQWLNHRPTQHLLSTQ